MQVHECMSARPGAAGPAFGCQPCAAECRVPPAVVMKFPSLSLPAPRVLPTFIPAVPTAGLLLVARGLQGRRSFVLHAAEALGRGGADLSWAVPVSVGARPCRTPRRDIDIFGNSIRCPSLPPLSLALVTLLHFCRD